MQSLVNYAVKYAERGLAVLPMMDKRPLIKFADQPPLTADEVRDIWQRMPYAQIAARTIDFLVIDIDEHENGADGFKSFADYSRDHGTMFPRTLTQKTAGGGRQMFYLKRDDMPVKQNIGWLPGVDVKAHVNNYVMIAPSKKSNGKQYEWENNNPIVTAPKELIQAINKRPGSKVTDFAPGKFQQPGQRTQTTELFEQITDGLGETGGRNNALASFVGGLLFRNVEPEKAYQLALIANGNTERALSDNEVKKTVFSIMEKEKQRRESIEDFSSK